MSRIKVVHDDIPLDELSPDERELLIHFFLRERTTYQNMIRNLNTRYPLTADVIRHRLHIIEHQLNNIYCILKHHHHYEYQSDNYKFR